jgi:hypothetical protein
MNVSPRTTVDTTLLDSQNTNDQNDVQNAKIKRIVGIALICVGLVFAAVSFAISYGFFPLNASLTLGLGLASGVVSLATLIAGVILKKKYSPVEETEENKNNEELDASKSETEVNKEEEHSDLENVEDDASISELNSDSEKEVKEEEEHSDHETEISLSPRKAPVVVTLTKKVLDAEINEMEEEKKQLKLLNEYLESLPNDRPNDNKNDHKTAEDELKSFQLELQKESKSSDEPVELLTNL